MKNKELFEKYKKNHRKDTREKIVVEYLDLVRFIARRFLYRGEPLDDLIQVGTMGLIKAIERFDMGLDIEFTTFATPTIIGEIKHYFRDDSHVLKIPRRLETMSRQIKQYINEYVQQQGRSPNISQIAEHLHISQNDIVEAMEAFEHSLTISLDSPIHDGKGGGGSSFSLLTSLTDTDMAIENAVDHEHLKKAMQQLTKREQRILHLRYYQNLQQWEIAKKLNISQVHVSRLLVHATSRLKRILVREAKEDRVYE